ncbi:UDP-glycosyltransferase UGT5-like [Achroia grisella]|uniref:UDP-glycosyltransferase UGT5-like n=1 Tax=Achroia grisella TaxID=688607 RepID=UPI0027D2411A|nr:UDP-glycosyltransferase UGT5-like [Achroia grisella]
MDIKTVIFNLVIIVSIEAFRILAVFPTPSISHQVVFRPLVQELVTRGHEVVVITTDPMYPTGGGPENLTEIDVGDTYELLKDVGETRLTVVNEYVNIRTSIETAIPMLSNVFYEQLKNDAVKRIIEDKNVTFDLLIIEAWLRPVLAFTHRFKVPVIRFGSTGSVLSEYEVMGSVKHPLYYPSNLCSRCANIENLTFLEKLYEIYNDIYISNVFNGAVKHENEVMRSFFGADMPSLDDLSDNVDLLISNVHRNWEFNRPMPISVVQVGGIHLKSECTLPEDLQKYLDSSINGVVYISFGTNVVISALSNDKLEAMISVLSQLPYDVLWKWDKDEMPGRPKNIKISKWLPQECLLRHPKIKLFLTQGGLQSTEEAIAAGVPLVGMPIMADQFGNTQNYVRHKIGVKLLFDDLTEENFRNALYTVLNDESYRQNVERLRTLIELDGGRTAARAARWVEHVVRHGGSHLRAPAARLHAAVYHQLHLLAELAAAVILAAFVLYQATKFLVRFVWRIFTMKVIIHRQSHRIEDAVHRDPGSTGSKAHFLKGAPTPCPTFLGDGRSPCVYR